MKNQNIRELLQAYIGRVYRLALEKSGDEQTAREITRRVMMLLKRTHEAGLSLNDDLADRLTADCCRENEYYNSRAVFKDGIIADMPDFDTALSEISADEVRAKARSDAENKAMAAQAAVRGAQALGARVITQRPSRPVSLAMDDPDDDDGFEDDLFDDRDESLFDDDGDDLVSDSPRRGVSTGVKVLLVLVLAAAAVCLAFMLITGGAPALPQSP